MQQGTWLGPVRATGNRCKLAKARSPRRSSTALPSAAFDSLAARARSAGRLEIPRSETWQSAPRNSETEPPEQATAALGLRKASIDERQRAPTDEELGWIMHVRFSFPLNLVIRWRQELLGNLTPTEWRSDETYGRSIMKLGEMELEAAAQAAAGNWRKFEQLRLAPEA